MTLGLKTTELPAIGGLDGSELLYIVDSDGNSTKIDLATLAQWIITEESIIPDNRPWRGARVARTSTLTGLASGTAIPWQTADIDTDSIFSLGAPTRLTVPNGVTKVRLFTSLQYEDLLTAGTVAITFRKNGASFTGTDRRGQVTVRSGTTGNNANIVCGFSGALSVAGGDYFEVLSFISMSNQDELQATSQTWFEMEIIEADLV
jgi:hypothetical protein